MLEVSVGDLRAEGRRFCMSMVYSSICSYFRKFMLDVGR